MCKCEANLFTGRQEMVRELWMTPGLLGDDTQYKRVGMDYDVRHVSSQNNLADIYTKALPRPVLTDLMGKLRLP